MSKKNAAAVQASTATPVNFVFDGIEYKNVSFGFNDLAELEQKFGLNMLFGEHSLAKPASITVVRALLFVILKKAGATHEVDGKQVPYSLDDIGNRLSFASIGTIFPVLMLAFKESSMPANPPQSAEEAATQS